MVEIPLIKDHNFAYGVAELVTTGLRRITARNPSAFTFHGTGTYILGEGEVAVIDPGPSDQAHIQALLDSVANEQVTHIIVTHCHRDHSPAAEPLKAATGAPTYAYGPHGGTASNPTENLEEGVDRDFAPDVYVSDGEQITGNGWTLECVHTPGHTSNHMCFAWTEGNALFTGDHVMGWSTTVIVPPDGSMTDYLSSLDKLLMRNEDFFWPTHGSPIKDPIPYLTALIEHRLQRIETIRTLLKPKDLRITDMVPEMYPDLQPELHGAAGLSTLASIQHLERLGEVQPIAGSGSDTYFRFVK